MKENGSHIKNSNAIANLHLQKKSNGTSLVRPVGEGNVSSSSGVVQRKLGDEVATSGLATIEEEGEDLSTLKGVASVLKNGGEIPQSPEELFDILKGPFEANWFKAKACLTMDDWPLDKNLIPSHKASLGLMTKFLTMRDKIWAKFQKNALPKIKEAVNKKKSMEGLEGLKNTEKLEDNLKVDDALGSDSVTSDIDYSLKGENTEIGVELLNTEFKTALDVPYEPGTVFDINVYSSDWMHGSDEVPGGKDGVVGYAPKAEAKPVSETAQKERAEMIEVWSMVKIRRNMSDQDWLLYKSENLKAVTSKEQRDKNEHIFLKTDFEYGKFKAEVKTRLEALKPKLEEAETKLLNKKASAFKDAAHYQEQAFSMSASNAIYQDAVLNVKKLRLRIEAIKGEAESPENKKSLDDLSKSLGNEIARALTFANEVYASEGGVLHTVLGKQTAKKKLDKLKSGESKSSLIPDKDKIKEVKFEVKKEHYLQSMNENVGDTLHSLNHNEKTPEYGVYRAGKYIDRMCEAAEELLGMAAARNVFGYPLLKEIGANAVVEKDKAAGKDPMAVKEDSSFFHKYSKSSDLAPIKKAAITFGATVQALYKNTAV